MLFWITFHSFHIFDIEAEKNSSCVLFWLFFIYSSEFSTRFTILLSEFSSRHTGSEVIRGLWTLPGKPLHVHPFLCIASTTGPNGMKSRKRIRIFIETSCHITLLLRTFKRLEIYQVRGGWVSQQTGQWTVDSRWKRHTDAAEVLDGSSVSADRSPGLLLLDQSGPLLSCCCLLDEYRMHPGSS